MTLSERYYSHRSLVRDIAYRQRVLAAKREGIVHFGGSLVSPCRSCEDDVRLAALLDEVLALEGELDGLAAQRAEERSQLDAYTGRLTERQRWAVDVYFYQGMDRSDAVTAVYGDASTGHCNAFNQLLRRAVEPSLWPESTQ